MIYQANVPRVPHKHMHKLISSARYLHAALLCYHRRYRLYYELRILRDYNVRDLRFTFMLRYPNTFP